MRSQKKTLLVMASFLLILALAAISNAQGAAANPRLQRQIAQERAVFGLKAFWGGLDITPTQKDQVQAILAKYKLEIQALARESVLARLELNRTIAAGASPEQLRIAFDQVTLTEENIVKLRATIALEVRQLLTADQLAKLQQRLQAVDTRLQNRKKRQGK